MRVYISRKKLFNIFLNNQEKLTRSLYWDIAYNCGLYQINCDIKKGWNLIPRCHYNRLNHDNFNFNNITTLSYSTQNFTNVYVDNPFYLKSELENYVHRLESPFIKSGILLDGSNLCDINDDRLIDLSGYLNICINPKLKCYNLRTLVLFASDYLQNKE